MRVPKGSLADLASRPVFWWLHRRGQSPHAVNRSYWTKRFIVLVGFVAVLFLVSWADKRYWPHIPSDDQSPADTTGGLLLIGFALWAIADWRIRRNRVHDVLAESDRRPILLLRSFEHDDEVVKHFPAWFSPQTWILLLRPRQLLHHVRNWYRFTFESLLRQACKRDGAVVGIGEPNEIVPSTAMKTEYHEDDDWRRRVLVLMEESQLIVFRAAISDGLVREITWAVERTGPEQLLIYVGRSERRQKALVALFGWFRTDSERREEFYGRFVAHCGPLFPRGLPTSIERHKFIRFDRNWAPILISQESRSPHPGLAERVGLWMNLATSGAPG